MIGLDAAVPMVTAAHLHGPVVRGDITALPLANGSVDAVVMVNVLDHLDEPGIALREARRVLRPEGLLDEAIYVLDGELLVVTGRSDARPVPAGSLVLAPRGTRHTFRNPSDRPVRVLGIWSPGSALEFIADVGAALPASGPPDPARLADVYRRHNSEVLP